MKPSVICIGASAGGVPAIQTLLNGFKSAPAVPIVVVQHIAESSQIDLKMVFGNHFKGAVIEALDKEPLVPGTVYFAPSGYHSLFERDLTLSLSQDELVNFARPSIDVAMESAAFAFGAGVWGVLLTGANSDGAGGLKRIQELGGYTVVQNPETADSPMMPQSALNIMTPNKVMELEDIAEHLNILLGSGL